MEHCLWLRPDGKSQVTVEYEDGKPVAVDTVVISAQHDEQVSRRELEDGILHRGHSQGHSPAVSGSRTPRYTSTPPAGLCWAAPRATRV